MKSYLPNAFSREGFILSTLNEVQNVQECNDDFQREVEGMVFDDDNCTT